MFLVYTKSTIFISGISISFRYGSSVVWLMKILISVCLKRKSMKFLPYLLVSKVSSYFSICKNNLRLTDYKFLFYHLQLLNLQILLSELFCRRMYTSRHKYKCLLLSYLLYHLLL